MDKVPSFTCLPGAQVKDTSAWQNKKETHDAEVEACANMRDGIADTEKQLEAMKKSTVDAEERVVQMQQEAQTAKEDSDEMQRRFLAGELSVEDGDGKNNDNHDNDIHDLIPVSTLTE